MHQFGTEPFSFKPVWRCIYCGDDSQPKKLTTEHIVPYGLGGNAMLPRSSCLDCNEITKKFEQDCLRTLLGVARAHLNVQTRRPHERSSEVTVSIDGVVQTIPLESDPSCILALPTLKHPPALLSGTETQNDLMLVFRTLHGKDEIVKRLESMGYMGPETAVGISAHVPISGLLPVSWTRSLGVMMEPEVDYGTQSIQP